MNCYECYKVIDEEEWVVNWGSCVECLDHSITEYFRNNPLPEEDDFTL